MKVYDIWGGEVKVIELKAKTAHHEGHEEHEGFLAKKAKTAHHEEHEGHEVKIRRASKRTTNRVYTFDKFCFFSHFSQYL